jgi:hypothetical protein
MTPGERDTGRAAASLFVFYRPSGETAIILEYLPSYINAIVKCQIATGFVFPFYLFSYYII